MLSIAPVRPSKPSYVGDMSASRTRWKAMPDVLLMTGIRSLCAVMGAPTTSEGSSFYLKRDRRQITRSNDTAYVERRPPFSA